ncbi:MAG: hypothetical protein MHMPM18_003031 [Marteilia pararefringens]
MPRENSSIEVFGFLREQDINLIKIREKRLSMGKQTLKYKQYLSDIPKQKRSPIYPLTPKNIRYVVAARMTPKFQSGGKNCTTGMTIQSI